MDEKSKRPMSECGSESVTCNYREAELLKIPFKFVISHYQNYRNGKQLEPLHSNLFLGHGNHAPARQGPIPMVIYSTFLNQP